MLRNCYSDKNSRRTTHPEAIEFFAQETGCLPVEGFIELLDKGDSFNRYEGLYARDALDKGWKLGIIASSDGHDGHPGEGQSFSFKHQHIYHFLGSGYVAVLAEDLTRKDVFEALYNRRCYGTTGVPIALDFSVNGYEMGSIIPAVSTNPVLRVICKGTNGIDHIRIVKNGRVVDTVFGHGEFMIDMEWKDKEYNKNNLNYYYVRVVQVDRESAWSSPIWIG